MYKVLFQNRKLVETFIAGIEAESNQKSDKHGGTAQVAETIKEIKLGRRKYNDTQSAIELCKEMFDAGYGYAVEQSKRRRLDEDVNN